MYGQYITRIDADESVGTPRGPEKGTSDGFEIVASNVENGKISAKDKESIFKNSANTTRSANTGTSRSVDFETSRSDDIETPRGSVWTSQEVSDLAPLINNTKENDLEESNIKSNHIISAKMQDVNMGYDFDMMSEMDAYDEIIKENISFDDLLVAYPYEIETIEGIKQLILETVLNKNESMVIASNTYPVALVKSKFLKLNYSHIEYVMDCFKSNTSKVKNIKKYLLAALFNAPSTMDSYYRAEVNHDMLYMTMARLET